VILPRNGGYEAQMNTLDSTTVVQIGIIVKDIHKTAKHYAEVFGIPEPEVSPIAADAFAKTNYHGRSSMAQAKGAFFHLGPVEIELIEPVGAPSTWEEFLRTHGEGIHHIAVKVKNIKAMLEEYKRKGLSLIDEEPKPGAGGSRIAFVHPKGTRGVLLELVERP